MRLIYDLWRSFTMRASWIKWPFFVLLCFIWGSSFILMKVSRDGLSASQIAALRIFSAALVCLPFALYHMRHFPAKKIPVLILTGLCGNLLPAFLFATAIFRIDSSLAGILNSLTPICVAVIGILLYRDKVRPARLAGILVGFAGLCLLTLSQNSLQLYNIGYAALILLATVCYGFNVNQVSHYLKGYKPVHIATVSISLMAIPAGLTLWADGFFQLNFGDGQIQWAVLNASLLGIVGSAVATALFYILVQQAGGLFASLVTYGIPFVALFWGILDGESITWITILCLLIILTGVFLANRPEK